MRCFRAKYCAVQSRRQHTTIALAVSLCLWTGTVWAYDASLVWRSVPEARGYDVYVSQTGEPDTGTDVGAPTSDADGHIRYVVHDLPLDATTSFWVACYNAKGIESALSNELSLTMGTAPAVTPSRTPTATPSRAGATTTSKATGTPNPKRAAKVTLTAYFFRRPTRHITFVARFRYLKVPNTLVLTPPNLTLSTTQPSPNSISVNTIMWQDVHPASKKVRAIFNLDDQVLKGSTFSASATLTDGFGLITNSSATVKVTH
jgi:hypothetical protein